MRDVLERTPLAVTRYGTDLEPNVLNGAELIKHRPLGRSFVRADIEIWEPKGTLGSGREFIEGLQRMLVFNAFSLNYARYVTGFPPHQTRMSDSILCPGSVFKAPTEFQFVRSLSVGRHPGVHWVEQLTGHELVARLRQSG